MILLFKQMKLNILFTVVLPAMCSPEVQEGEWSAQTCHSPCFPWLPLGEIWGVLCWKPSVFHVRFIKQHDSYSPSQMFGRLFFQTPPCLLPVSAGSKRISCDVMWAAPFSSVSNAAEPTWGSVTAPVPSSSYPSNQSVSVLASPQQEPVEMGPTHRVSAQLISVKLL